MINTGLKYLAALLLFLPGPVLKAQVKDAALSAAGFIRNEGQWENRSAFLLRIKDAEVYLETHAFQYFFQHSEDVAAFFSHSSNPHLRKSQTVRQHAVRMEFAGAHPAVSVSGNKARAHHLNFITGNNPQYWKSGVGVFDEVLYHNLYNGINARIYQGNETGLKYDFYVQPGSDPAQVRMVYRGADRIFLRNGSLVIRTSVSSWVESRPYAFQNIGGVQREVPCEFVVHGDTVSYRIGNYNPGEVLVIDPKLVFSTYSGSTADNFGHTATFDNSGNLYTAGIVERPAINRRYPVTAGAFQTTWGGGSGTWPQDNFPCDIAISKYNNDGSELLYATYFGGNRNDYPVSLVVDDHEQLIMLGVTLSDDFPTKPGAYDRIKASDHDLVISRFTSDGRALVGSTFFGGNGIDGLNSADSLLMNYADEFRGEVQVTTNGDIVIVSSTTSTDLITGTGAYQPAKGGMQDGVIARFDSALTTLKNCTYFGKSRHDAIYSLDIDPAGNIVVAGGTQSTEFTPGTGFVKAGYAGGIADGFVARFNGTLTSLLGMRYWGSTNYDQAYFVKLDPMQNVLVMGQAFDSISVTPNTYYNSRGTIFVSKFGPTLSNVIFSTRLGNTVSMNALSPSAFMVDLCGRVYGSVWGGATNLQSWYNQQMTPAVFRSTTAAMPLTPDALQSTTDNSDFWLFVLSPSADSLTYATYLGEPGGADHVDGGTSRFDKRGIIYQSVCASCSRGTAGSFPTTAGSYSPDNRSYRCSNASVKLDFRQGNVLTADFGITPRNGCTDSQYVFKNTSYNGQKFYWYLNDVLVDSTYDYAKTITASGTYSMKLLCIDPARCNPRDSITKTFRVSAASHADFSVTRDTCSSLLFFRNNSSVANNEPVPFTWYFGDGNISKDTHPVYHYADNGNYTVRLITSEGGQCADTASLVVSYDSLSYKLVAAFGNNDTLLCEPAWIRVSGKGNNGQTFTWYVNDVPVHTGVQGFDSIAQKGTYRIKLVVEDPSTCVKKDSAEHTYKVFPQTDTDFEWELDSCTLGVRFINRSIMIPGDSVHFFWDFGDGTFSTDSAPHHEYADTGSYMVELTANRGFTCEHTTYKKVVVMPGIGTLNASFILTPDPLCEPGRFTATDKSINSAKNYWYVNGVLTDSTTNFSDSVRSSGTVTVTLISRNEHTCREYDTAVKTLTAYPSAVAGFTAMRDTCSPRVIFTNSSASGSQSPITYLWDLGDGTTSTARDTVHEYAADGTYLVRLIAQAGTPCADTAEQPVSYRRNEHVLEVSIGLTDTALCTPAYLHAVWNGINGKQAQWLLNNVPVSTDSIYRDTLSTEGRYSLKLIVSDSNTCARADTVERFFDVALFAKAEFLMRRDSCSLQTQFENRSGSNTVPFKWYFGDGDSSTEFSPAHTYRETDYYTVQLIYSPGTYCADTAEHIYFIDGDSAQEVKIPNVFTPNGDGVNDCYSVTGINTKCDEFYLKVYNRWGTVVFETTDSRTCWDGTNQGGADIPQGVYYYVIEIRKTNGYRLNDRGTITLIRE